MKSLPKQQQGFVLLVGLIMLLLLTMIVSTAVTLSRANLDSVGNVQWRSEALAAADAALEQVTSSAFTTAPQAQSLNIDINHDNNTDYVVAVAQPECVQVKVATLAPPSSLQLTGISNSTWNTVWDISANVQDPATGASVRVRSGVRILLSDSSKNIACP